MRERVCMQRRGQFVTQVTMVAPKGLTIKAALRWKGDRTRRVPRRLRGRRDGAALGLGALVLRCAAAPRLDAGYKSKYYINRPRILVPRQIEVQRKVEVGVGGKLICKI